MAKPRKKIREELTTEITDSKKRTQQFENWEKMLHQKLSQGECWTRSYRLPEGDGGQLFFIHLPSLSLAQRSPDPLILRSFDGFR